MELPIAQTEGEDGGCVEEVVFAWVEFALVLEAGAEAREARLGEETDAEEPAVRYTDESVAEGVTVGEAEAAAVGV